MHSIAFLGNLAGPDLIIILLIILVLFGAKRLPDLAKGMGQAMKEFQKAKEDLTSELHQTGQNEPHPTAATGNVPRLESNPAAPAAAAAPAATETGRSV